MEKKVDLLEEVTRAIYGEWEAKHDIKISEDDIRNAVQSAADTLTDEEIKMGEKTFLALMEEWIRDREDDIVDGIRDREDDIVDGRL